MLCCFDTQAVAYAPQLRDDPDYGLLTESNAALIRQLLEAACVAPDAPPTDVNCYADLYVGVALSKFLPSLPAEDGMDTSAVIAWVNAINARIWSLMTGRPGPCRDTYPSWTLPSNGTLCLVPPAMVLSNACQVCANWAAAGECLTLALRVARANALEYDEFSALLSRLHKARMVYQPSAGFTGASGNPKRTVTQETFKNFAQALRSGECVSGSRGYKPTAGELEAMFPSGDDHNALINEFHAALKAAGGFKSFEFLHWHEQGRCRPGWAWAQLRLLEDEDVSAEHMRDVHSALFGSEYTLSELRQECNIWLSYGK